ncbi:MAG TPA: hypothetical protein VN523_01195 [Hyphomicrobiaceae bacterium]|jgi:hypothetical protein|nr:hypothetical protein [Hyphomicrobiaceae bacterium]
MRVILTLVYAVLLVSTQALPAGAALHAAMYCWVPDFEIAVACDDEDEGGSDGDDSLRTPVPADRVGARSSGAAAQRLGSERP